MNLQTCLKTATPGLSRIWQSHLQPWPSLPAPSPWPQCPHAILRYSGPRSYPISFLFSSNFACPMPYSFKISVCARSSGILIDNRTPEPCLIGSSLEDLSVSDPNKAITDTVAGKEMRHIFWILLGFWYPLTLNLEYIMKQNLWNQWGYTWGNISEMTSF